MRLSIDHHSVYRFSEPQARVVQLLRVTPLDYAAQTVIDWRIDVDCDARLRHGRDGFGNATAMLYIDGPIERLALTVRGQVLTDDMGGVVEGIAEPLPPLVYTRATPATQAGERTRRLARTAQGSDPLERAHALAVAVSGAVAIHGGRSTAARTPDEIVASGEASVRDAAHLLAAAARVAGLPARIVSGHALHGPDRATRQTAHYWAELHLAGPGWVGFDPCSGCSPDESYVRVAVGLDGSDVAPVSGTRRGGGIEELDVALRVDEASGGTDA